MSTQTRHESTGSTGARTPIDVGLATTIEEFDAAFRLVHDQYVARGYMAPSATGRRITPYHALPSTRVFVARAAGRVVGTVSLVPDSPDLMPCDALYHRELAPLRIAERRLAEVSSLAVDERLRGVGLSIVRSLVQVVAVYASRVARVDELCITVHPHHAKFYETLLGFRRLAGPKPYEAVGGAPAVALRLDLARTLGQTVSADVFPFAAALFTRPEIERVLSILARDLEHPCVTPPVLLDREREARMQLLQSEPTTTVALTS